jgi:hypothetical protein
VLTQRVLLQKKLLQLLLLFLRKLQLFVCQFKEPSVLLAVQDFSIPSKPGHPQALINIISKDLIVNNYNSSDTPVENIPGQLKKPVRVCFLLRVRTNVYLFY